jgi:hypothetical protein
LIKEASNLLQALQKVAIPVLPLPAPPFEVGGDLAQYAHGNALEGLEGSEASSIGLSGLTITTTPV